MSRASAPPLPTQNPQIQKKTTVPGASIATKHPSLRTQNHPVPRAPIRFEKHSSLPTQHHPLPELTNVQLKAIQFPAAAAGLVQAGSRAYSWTLSKKLLQEGEGHRAGEFVKRRYCKHVHVRGATAAARSGRFFRNSCAL